jgi:uncharacterized protein YndB with AHSA1/START domain
VPAGTEGLILEMRRVLPAAPRLVFAAFTDPNELKKWFGPQGFTVPSAQVDPHVGGAYRLEMRPPEGDAFYLGGQFREIDPPARLVFTFAYEDPDPDDVENVVELSFRSRGAETEVAFTQGPFRTEARRRLHEDGWRDSFDKLERLLSAGA